MGLVDDTLRSPESLKVSFEFFPPKTEKMAETLWNTFDRLAPLSPSFVSVTYGAGGSTRERTHDIVRQIRQKSQVPPAAHLTCVAATREEVDEVANSYWEAGIHHIVALRGDPPEGEDKFKPHPGGYESGADLVEGLKRLHDFEISVAAYPEIHPDSADLQSDLDNLKRKLDAGADRAITQFFFDPEDFLRFRDAAVSAGIDSPLVPGLLPVTNVKQSTRVAASCGAGVPDWLHHLFENLDDDPDTRRLVSAYQCARQVLELRAEGIDQFHFYTLNRAELTYAICHILGLRPKAS